MIAALRASRPNRSFRPRFAAPALIFGLAAFLSFSGAAAHAAPPVAVAPTPLGAAASATPEVQPPAAPQALVLTAPPPGSAGPAIARGEGEVAAGRPVTFLLRPESAGLFSIGVSSPENGARISIYLGDSTEAATGTAMSDGAIRWSTELAAGESVRIVVHTASGEIPFRVEAVAGAGGI